MTNNANNVNDLKNENSKVFIMIRYKKHKKRIKIEKAIKNILNKYKLDAQLANDYIKNIDLLKNIRDFMDDCKYGIAVIENIDLNKINYDQNILFELGYMLGSNKKCLLLIDKNIKEKCPIDIRGMINNRFDINKIDNTMIKIIEDWCINTLNMNIFLKKENIKIKEREIHDASTYKKEDLYLKEDETNNILLSVNDLVWDHQLLVFAYQKGFFQRIGIQIDLKKYYPKTLNDYNCVEKVLTNEKPGTSIVACPRTFMDKKIQKYFSDFAIINVFTGFALIGKKGIMETFDKTKPEESFKKLIINIINKKIKAEDHGALDFIKAIEEMINLTNNKTKITLDVKLHHPGSKNIIDCLETENIDFIAGTAPMRYLATMKKYQIYLDFNDLMKILDIIKITDDDKSRLLSRLLIHNCWNINVPSDDWRNYKTKILRLASVALYTLEYITDNKSEISKFIASEWQNSDLTKKYPLDLEKLSDTFNISYYLVPYQRIFDIILDQDTDFRFDNVIQFLIKNLREKRNEKVVFNSREIFNELLRLKVEYTQEMRNFEKLSKKENMSNENILKINELNIKAKRQFQIRNFYDSVQYLKKANEIIMQM